MNLSQVIEQIESENFCKYEYIKPYVKSIKTYFGESEAVYIPTSSYGTYGFIIFPNSIEGIEPFTNWLWESCEDQAEFDEEEGFYLFNMIAL